MTTTTKRKSAVTTKTGVIPALSIPTSILKLMEGERYSEAVEKSRYGNDVTLSDVTADELQGLHEAAKKTGDKSLARFYAALSATLSGEFGTIKRTADAPALIEAYLRQDARYGWVFKRSGGDRLDAYLVTRVKYEEPTRERPAQVIMSMAYVSPVGGETSRRRMGEKSTPMTTYAHWDGAEIRGKTPADLLIDSGYLRETEDLHEEYARQEESFRQVLTTGFAQVYRYTGQPTPQSYSDKVTYRNDVKVVHDVHPSEIRSVLTEWAGILLEDGEQVLCPLPLHFDLRVFDLTTHQFYIVSGLDLKPHDYDKSLRDKLVLPADQRELLDILTTDIETFTADIVEGKSAGNVILSKGVPGVGKTLTAEVYAELMEKPLYSIHSGSLGITAESVRKSLEEIFTRAARWDAVLLLDEADVFVIERGSDLTQNAIVAEFLRTMEYFDGLLFMTTNRASHIDEAIISRCAAIIDYRIPTRGDAIKIWHVLATNSGVDLDSDLVQDLWEGFQTIAPRDVKMLLRLALRVAANRDEPLSVDLFRRCAMFRGLHYDTSNTLKG